MKKHRAVLSAVLLTALVLTGRFLPRRSPGKEAVFRGRTTTQWEKEVGYWDVSPDPCGSGRRAGLPGVLCSRKAPLWKRGLETLGLDFAPDRSTLPLLEGNPSSVPVLVELLKSADPATRRVAVNGLAAVGGAAPGVVPALVSALGDKEEAVASDAAIALHRLDPDALDKGLRKLGFPGLVLRPR